MLGNLASGIVPDVRLLALKAVKSTAAQYSPPDCPDCACKNFPLTGEFPTFNLDSLTESVVNLASLTELSFGTPIPTADPH